MGCCSSSPQSTIPVGTQRRRLSVGEVDADGDNGPTAESMKEERGVVAMLRAEDVLKLVEDSSDARKWCITSTTDQGGTSFANKSQQMLGLGDKNDVDASTSGLGYTCRKGLKPESPNQDSFSILKVEGNFSLYGVYDGHGKKGHDVSNFVKDNLPKLILKDPRFRTNDMPEMLIDVFKKTQSFITTLDATEQLSAQMSGTTASICFHDHVTNKLMVAHVADSTVVLGEFTDTSKKQLKGRALTRDHKPDLEDERMRIEKAGGRVVFDGYANHRVYAKNARYPGLNMSRCLGDLLGHQDAGCSCIPEVGEIQLGPLSHVLLVCSDGVWEFITPDEAVNLVTEFPSAMMAAERLAKESWDRWMREEGGSVVDDITVILVQLHPRVVV